MATRHTRKFRGGLTPSTRNLFSTITKNGPPTYQGKRGKEVIGNILNNITAKYYKNINRFPNSEQTARRKGELELYTLKSISDGLIQEYFEKSKSKKHYNNSHEAFEDAYKYSTLVIGEIVKKNLQLRNIMTHNNLVGYNLSDSSANEREIFYQVAKIKADSFKKVLEPNPIKRFFKRSRHARRNIY